MPVCCVTSELVSHGRWQSVDSHPGVSVTYSYTEAELAARAEQLSLYIATVDAEKAAQAARSASIDSRAGVLVGASAVVGALKIGEGLDATEWIVLSLAFAAAIIGLWVTRPRSTWGYTLPIVRDFVLDEGSTTPLTAKFLMAEEKVWQVGEIEKKLVQRSAWVSVGYGILAASVLATLILTATTTSTS